MRKKVAVFADCSGNDLIAGVLSGAERAAKQNDTDAFYFGGFILQEETAADNLGERNIYNLPNLDDFDGVLLLSFSINDVEIRENIRDRILISDVPAVTLDLNMDDLYGIETDNEIGMYQLVKHLTECHNVRKVVYISGVDCDENSKRLAGARRALAEVDSIIDDKDVICSTWSYYATHSILLDWLKSGHELPDAFVCASDMLAMGACKALEDFGLKVPDDCIVTGYDCISSADTFVPAITTVDRSSSKLGEKGMEKLLKLIDGEETPYRELVSSEARIGESCGCSFGNFFNLKRNEICKKHHVNSMSNMTFERKIWSINRKLSSVKDVDMLIEQLKEVVSSGGINWVRNQIMFLDERYFEAMDSRVYSGEKDGYSESMTSIYVDKETGKATTKKISTRQLLPFEVSDTTKPHSYIFMPLHGMDMSYGYIVYVDAIDSIMDMSIMSWGRNLNQFLARAMESLKLEKAYEKLWNAALTDTLSGLYNRQGFNDVAIPMLMNNQKNQLDSALIMIDIDRMKKINDENGHLSGDQAIALVGRAISEALPEKWMGVRYGGDEFIVLGQCGSTDQLHEVENQIQRKLTEITKKENISYTLTISVGGMFIEGNEELDLDSCIQMADDTMYRMKCFKREKITNWLNDK